MAFKAGLNFSGKGYDVFHSSCSRAYNGHIHLVKPGYTEHINGCPKA